MFYNFTSKHRISDYWTTALRGNEGYFPWENTEKGFCKPVVTILVFNLLIHNLVLCVFLFKDTSFNKFNFI